MCCAGSGLSHEPNHSFRGLLQRVCNASEYAGDLETSTMRRPLRHIWKKIKKNEGVCRFFEWVSLSSGRTVYTKFKIDKS